MNKTKKIIYKLFKALNCQLSDIETLSEEQVNYINRYLGTSSFLEACPGSGKTEVIGIKTAYEITKWRNVSGGLAIITFTNSAATELYERIDKFTSLKGGLFPHFVGTFDSWLHNYIFQPFAHSLVKYTGSNGDCSMRLIDHDSHADFLNAFTVNIGANHTPIRATDYHYGVDWTTLIGHNDITDATLRGDLSVEEKKALRVNKIKFLQAGFATYADAEILSVRLMQKHPELVSIISKRFPAIIVDECQDLSDEQIKILEFLRNAGSSLHFIGDLNQSIYEFRKVDPQNTLGYINRNAFQKLKLTHNFRSNQQIVNTCQSLIGSDVPVLANRNPIMQNSCILWQYNQQTFSSLPEHFERLIQRNNLSLAKCAILSRGKLTILPLRSDNDKSRLTNKVELFAIALIYWNKLPKNTEGLTNALKYIGRAICLLAFDGRGNSQSQYCPPSYDAIEWRILLKRFLNASVALYPFEENGQNLNWRDWTRKLKTFLQAFWPTIERRNNEFNQIATRLRAPNGKGDAFVSEIDNSPTIHNLIRTTTIHSVKGETMDAVMLLSHQNRQSKGGHFSQWLREGEFNEEYIRFAYVACSRPKHILVVATPQLDEADLLKLRNLGFIDEALIENQNADALQA